MSRGAIRCALRGLRLAAALALLAGIAACAPGGDATAQAGAAEARAAAPNPAPRAATPARRASGRTATAIFAGGCFWCMEPPFDPLPGVLETTSGYTGGHVANPTYEQVSAGGTGHAEAVRVTYDPARIDYATLLDVFWHNIDPVAVERQFCDRGDQYRSAIFVADGRERGIAEKSRRDLQASGRFHRPIATQIVAAGTFWPAEEYHQDYYEKNPIRYKYYRYACGRDQRLQQIWGDSAG